MLSKRNRHITVNFVCNGSGRVSKMALRRRIRHGLSEKSLTEALDATLMKGWRKRFQQYHSKFSY